MAKKDTKTAPMKLNEEKEGVVSRIISILIWLFIIVILMSIIIIFIKLDIGKIGSGVLRPVLKDVPVVNWILPEVPENIIADENGYEYDNLTDAVNKIKELQQQLKDLEKTKTDNEKTIQDLQTEVARLKVFEDASKEFNKRVLDFDKNVVMNEKAPDISEYATYYEGINPENAAEIYRQVIEQQQIDEKTKQQGERYSKMEPKAAAEALQIMTGDLDLVSEILMSMSTTKSSLIMQEMEPDFCAKISKKMLLMAQ